MNKIFNFCLIFLFTAVLFPAQYIHVDPSTYTAEQLIKDIFIGTQNTRCITISNVSASGWQKFGSRNSSYGYFAKGILPFDFEKGIILSTGSAQNAPGPNNVLLDDQDSNWPGDQDLADALQESYESYLNATSIEFDFVAHNTSGISFEYLFLSEEYLPKNCTYSDAFAFLIKKAGSSGPYTNIALVPGTQDPVTSLSINTASNCPRNTAYFGSFNGINSPTAFDGQTKILTAKADIIPGEKYHIKLVIADHLGGSDRTGRYDSAVFLKAGSFVGKKDLGPDLLISTNNPVCEGSSHRLDASTEGATSYQWFKDGEKLTDETKPTLNIAGVSTNNGFYEVEINLDGCQLKGSVRIEFSEKPGIIDKNFCNYNNGAPNKIKLQDLNKEFITNYKDYFEVKYFSDSTHLNQLNNDFSYTTDTTIYAQVKSGNCPVVNATLYLNTPKKSNILVDQTICPTATTTLKAETGFTHYKWMHENGELINEGNDLNKISDIPVGKYKVELTSPSGCSLEQEVTVFAAQLPEITNIDVTGNTARVYVSGGNPGYEYSMDSKDDNNFTGSPIFTGIPRGLHKMYVRDTNKCQIVEKEFLIINLINVITPNGDGINDVLDYSDLRIKDHVSLHIFDRYGHLVFAAKDHRWIWDGKHNGRPLPTGNYWYVLNWTEPDTQIPVSYKGWILLKNRN